jgi:ATP-dependent Clp protease ATP-binding subunit ClpA
VSELLSAESDRVLAMAADEAVGLGQDFTGTEHILLGLVACDDAVAAPLLAKHGIVASEIRAQVAGAGGVGHDPSEGTQSLTARAKQVLTLAAKEAEGLGDDAVEPEHLLLGIIRQATGVAALLLRDMGADLAELREEVFEAREAREEGFGTTVRRGVFDGDAGSLDGDATAESVASTDARDDASSGPAREVVPPLCPGCGQRLSEVLATASIVPAGSTVSGRRRSFGNVTVIFCGACGLTLSANR